MCETKNTGTTTSPAIPTDPDALVAFIRERAIKIENDLSSVHDRGWCRYYTTLAELGLDADD